MIESDSAGGDNTEEMALNRKLKLEQFAHQIVNVKVPTVFCAYTNGSVRNKNISRDGPNRDDKEHHVVSPLNCAKRENVESFEYITRYNMGNEKLKYCMARLAVLDKWSNYPVIAIDGQNGTTKSTLAKSLLHRKLLKINDFMPYITSGSDYNHHVLKSIEYMYGQVCFNTEIKPEMSGRFVVWDRCCFSNLIFYFIHQLMHKYRSTYIPEDYVPVWQFLNMMAVDTNLMSTINVLKHYQVQMQQQSQNCNGALTVGVPTVFLVCRNMDFVALTLRQRGINTESFNDIYNSVQFNYQMAQYYVYIWFSQLLDCPCFDIADFLEAGCSIQTIHMLFAQKLNPTTHNNTVSTTSSNNNNNNQAQPQVSSAAEDIIAYCQSPNTMVYDFSQK